MPPGCVYVGRPTKWGNPFKVIVGPCPVGERYYGNGAHDLKTLVGCIGAFREWLLEAEDGRRIAEMARRELRGKDLACWCPVGHPCHADVLLEVANEV